MPSAWLSKFTTVIVPTLSEALERVRELDDDGLVYLGGPIYGCSDEECHGWRYRVIGTLGVERCFNPILWDHRGEEEAHKDEIVERDLAALRRSSVLLVNAAKCGWGTAMEVFYASFLLEIPVIAFMSVD